MRVAIVTTVWRRHATTAAFWCWARYLQDWWKSWAEVEFVAAGTADPRHERMAQEAGAHYVDTANEPLARKFNTALKVARQLQVDAVLIMGSDDVFCERTARAYRWALQGEPYLGLTDLYYYQTVDGRIGYFPGYLDKDTGRLGNRLGEAAGPARLIPATYLQKLGWELWSERPYFSKRDPRYRQRGMDHSSFRRMAMVAPPMPLVTLRELGATALDLKGPDNLWSIEETNARPLPAGETVETVLGRLPEDLRAMILALRQSAEAVA